MRRIVPLFLAGVIYFCSVSFVHAEENSAQEKPGLTSSFVLEYLPNFVYHDENITAVVRVQNRGSGLFKGYLAVESGSDGGSICNTVQRDVTLAAKGEIRFNFSIELMLFKQKVQFVRFVLKGEDTKSSAAVYTVRIIHAEDALPEYALDNGLSFRLASGDRVIFIIQHMKFVQKRKWVFAKWFKHKVLTPRSYSSFLFLGAPLCRDEDTQRNYMSLLDKWVPDLTFVRLTDFSDQGAYPVLANAVRFREVLFSFLKERVILFMPYSDFIAGTGKREYRMCVEFMIQRLKRVGYAYSDIKIIAPAVPEKLEKQFRPYIHELADIARVYYIPFAVPRKLGDPLLWAQTGCDERVVARYPTPEGHRKIAEYLENEIK